MLLFYFFHLFGFGATPHRTQGDNLEYLGVAPGGAWEEPSSMQILEARIFGEHVFGAIQPQASAQVSVCGFVVSCS